MDFLHALSGLRHFLSDRMDLWVLSGPARAAGCFTAAFVGSAGLKNHFARMAFGAGWQEVFLGKAWLWAVLPLVKARFPDCSLALFEMDEARAASARFLKTSLRNPVWMPVEMEVRGTLKESMRRDKLRSILKKITENRFDAEVRTDGSSFDDFYHNMYVPLVKARHGDAVSVSAYADLRRRFDKHGELVTVKRGGEPLGAYLLDYGHEKPRMLEMGVRDGSEELLEAGVSSAAYYFSFARILERGGATVVLGNSRGFLNDGPLGHKLALGGRISPQPYRKTGHLHFRFLRRDPALRAFLAQNPLVAADPDGSCRVAQFAESAAGVTPETGKTFERFCRGGLGARLYLFEGPDAVERARPGLAAAAGPCEVASALPLFG